MRLRKLWLALLIGVLAAFAVTTSAFAAENEDAQPAGADIRIDYGSNPDPQTTNVPYIGWLGNQIPSVCRSSTASRMRRSTASASR
jgi:hypothetical protein